MPAVTKIEREKENERTVARNLRRVTIQDVIVRKKRNNVLFDALKKYKHDRSNTYSFALTFYLGG